MLRHIQEEVTDFGDPRVDFAEKYDPRVCQGPDPRVLRQRFINIEGQYHYPLVEQRQGFKRMTVRRLRID